MRALSILSRAVAPLALAMAVVGALSTAAWASPPLGPHRPGPPITLRQCRFNGGVVIRDRQYRRQYHCQGGRFGGRPISG